MKKLWVVVVLLLVGSWHLDAPGAAVLQVDGGAPVPDCEEWNTPEFFETATVEDVTACLAAGADVNARTEDGYTPLHHAAWGNVNAAVVEALLDAGANAAARGLFLEAAAVPGASGNRRPQAPDSVALRSRLVTIDFAQLASSDVAVAARAGGTSAEAPRSVRPAYGELLRLNLFDDTAFTGVVERIEPTFSGGYAISGRLLGVEGGTMTLVVNGDVVAGTIRTLETTYRIRPAGNGLHTVSEVDLSRLPPLGEPILVEPEGRRPAVQR